MAKYRITAPDGSTYEVTAPDTATEAEVMAYAKANYKPSTPPSPVDGMSRFERAAAGAGKAVSDFGSGLKQRLDEAAAGLESAIPGGQAISRFFGGKTAAEIRDAGQAEVAQTKARDAALMRDPFAIGGNIAGGISTGAVAAPLGPIGAGAAMGFATPTTDGAKEVLTNMGLGAGAGYVGDKAAKALSRVVQPKVNPNVQTLLDEGITPTPGQIMGGNMAKMEAKATSLPFVGDSIVNAQRRAGAQLNDAAFNRALAPLGESLPKGVTGRDAVAFANERLSEAYNKLLPKMTAQADDAFVGEINSLKSMVAEGAIDPKVADAFKRIVDTRVLGKFQGQASMTGETIKSVESHLGKEIARFRRSPDPDVNLMADALQEVQSSLRGLVTRNNPQFSKELQAINTGYANFKRVQRAASYLGSDEGVFSPAQLESAVKAMDRSKDHSAFAKGTALMQDLSGPAKAVMGPKYPDSGTAGRLMNVGALAAGVHSPAIPAGLLAGMGMYSQPAQKAMAALLTQRPEYAGLLASQIEALSPVTGLLGSSLALQ